MMFCPHPNYYLKRHLNLKDIRAMIYQLFTGLDLFSVNIIATLKLCERHLETKKGKDSRIPDLFFKKILINYKHEV